MSIKSRVKHLFLGPPGSRPRKISCGLLKGYRFHVDPARKSMRLMGLDETEIAGEVRRLSAQAATALDVGCNDGWYSLYLAGRNNIQRVYSFDGSGECLTGMKSNLALNDEAIAGKVTMIQKLVGAKNDDPGCSIDATLTAPAEPILFKIDVDGGELDVLRGAKQTLTNRKCLLIIETHSTDLERDCIAFLSELGYRCRIIPPGWYRAFVPEYRPIPHNQWFVATRA